jgi:hypothetical protein
MTESDEINLEEEIKKWIKEKRKDKEFCRRLRNVILIGISGTILFYVIVSYLISIGYVIPESF